MATILATVCILNNGAISDFSLDLNNRDISEFLINNNITSISTIY